MEGLALGVIDDKLREHLLVSDPVCPILHILPKIQKHVFLPTSRPIVAGIGSVTEKRCIWLDSLLQPLVKCVTAIYKTQNNFYFFFVFQLQPQYV